MRLSIFAFIAIVFFAFFPSSSFAKSSRTSGHRMDRSSVALILDGDDGELNHHFKDMGEVVYIFDVTLEEMLQFDFGEGEKVPLLEELIQVAAKKTYINLEVKTPQDPR
jgi:ABC-type oligopeptide transport system substrate-binding subunit